MSAQEKKESRGWTVCWGHILHWQLYACLSAVPLFSGFEGRRSCCCPLEHARLCWSPFKTPNLPLLSPFLLQAGNKERQTKSTFLVQCNLLVPADIWWGLPWPNRRSWSQRQILALGLGSQEVRKLPWGFRSATAVGCCQSAAGCHFSAVYSSGLPAHLFCSNSRAIATPTMFQRAVWAIPGSF